MAKPLTAEVMWQARQLYEEKDDRGRQAWSMMEIAAKLGISETSVFRAVHNRGRFANINNEPLPRVRSEEELKRDAQASLEKLQKLLAEERDEQTPGKTRADKMLMEIENPKVREQYAGYTGRTLPPEHYAQLEAMKQAGEAEHQPKGETDGRSEQAGEAGGEGKQGESGRRQTSNGGGTGSEPAIPPSPLDE